MSATTEVPTSSLPARGRSPYRFAVGVVVATLILIKAGAMVTSTGSGLAYADWPLAKGEWWPAGLFDDPKKLPGLLEHGHRAIGALIGVLVLTLTIWVGRADSRPWLRRLVIGVLALVCAQGVIGGLGIEKKLPAITSVTHGVLAQVILCLLVLVAFALSPAWAQRHPLPGGAVRATRKLASIALALVFAQLVAGAILRHTNSGGMLWLHIGMAMAVSLTILLAAFAAGHHARELRGFRRLSRIALALLACQLILGVVALIVRRGKDPSNIEYLGRSFLITLHVVVGALLFLSAALLVFRSHRNLEPVR